MPGVVIRGVVEQVPLLLKQPLSWKDKSKYHLRAEDYTTRSSTAWIRGIVLHTTTGKVGQVLPGLGPNNNIDERTLAYWSTTQTSGGAHFVFDTDASSLCLADLQTESAYHATTVNGVTIGIEIGQVYVGGVATVYEEQLRQIVVLVDFLTKRFGIQRQIQQPYHGSSKPVSRLVSGGADCVGVYGHRDQTDDRGQGDPGDRIYALLCAAGYAAVDFAADDDKAIWKPIQTQLNKDLGTTLVVDGVPGPKTRTALVVAGYPNGLLVARPGD